MTVKETAERAGQALNEGYRATVDKASEALSSARSKTAELYSGTRGAAAERIDSNPLAAVIGGLSLGVLLGSLLPRTRQERELLGPYGRQINSRARDAAQAARVAGAEKLDELGFNKDRAKDTVQQLVDTAKTAATEAAAAAARTARDEASGSNTVKSSPASGSASPRSNQ